MRTIVRLHAHVCDGTNGVLQVSVVRLLLLEDISDHFAEQFLVVDRVQRADIEQARDVEDVIVVDDAAEPLRGEEILLDARSQQLMRGQERFETYR